MDIIKKGAMSLGAVVVAGVIIAGQVVGWRNFLPSFSSAVISVAPSSRPGSESFFADEKLWVTLSDAETDRVYWVFDESSSVIAGDIQLQYTFPFDASTPLGTESRRRIDAFYKDGDDYRHVATRVSVRNIQITADSSFGPQGLTLTLPSELPGNWKLGAVQLTRLTQGQFRDVGIQPTTSVAGNQDTRMVFDSKTVATQFGYPSSADAELKLMSDRTAWVTAEYKGPSPADTLTVVKPLGGQQER